MTNKETLEFITKLIDFTKEQINYFKNKIVEDEQYPTLQQCHKEELIAAQEGLARLHQIKKDLEVLEWLKKSIISKKRIQSLRETANPIYEIILHIPQNILKEVLGNGC